MARTLSQIYTAVVSAGAYAKASDLSAIDTDVSDLKSLNFFDSIAGSPFIDMAALEAQYATDTNLTTGAEAVVVGDTLYQLVDIGQYADQVTVTGWTAKALRRYLTAGDIAGLSGNISALETALDAEVTRATGVEAEIQNILDEMAP